MIGSDTPCKVIPLKNGLNRQGRRGVPGVSSGRMLYYLWHEPTGLYYFECYTDETYALKKAISLPGPRDMKDVSQAWRSEAKYCEHSWRTKEGD